MPKFIQIAAAKYVLYALDESGQVWKYEEQSRRTCQGDHYAHSCDFQTVEYWKALPQCYGFPGWPLTEEEQAEAEVDALLR